MLISDNHFGIEKFEAGRTNILGREYKEPCAKMDKVEQNSKNRDHKNKINMDTG